jgi:tRNA-splicing ligase RtcB (3'-phosphate/5'-hydroxy nucleic acid ligase)
MQLIRGQSATASVMTDSLDAVTRKQIVLFLDQPSFAEHPIVIMPDCHAGKGSVIGFTMKLGEYVIPNIIGVDIGCGIEAYRIGKCDIDYPRFDRFVRDSVPAGRDVHEKKRAHGGKAGIWDGVDQVLSWLKQGYAGRFAPDTDRVRRSLGTLGGGNHFIEIDEDDSGGKWLIIHTGSRNFGKQVAEYYQQRAADHIADKGIEGVPRDLAYLPRESRYGREYMEAMRVAQEYAAQNRRMIAAVLLGYFENDGRRAEMGESVLRDVRCVKSVHNYISFSDDIIRKGAISAHAGEELIVPLSMRDGVIIGTGKGNIDWNCSAPHGAGRVLSRTQAKETLDMKDYVREMSGVWSSCVNRHTLDESPMAYKPKSAIIPYLTATMDVQAIMKPVYNFKAAE